MSINIYYDGVLIGLRKSRNNKSEGKSDYNIPRGGLFELISGANYLGEIVEWWGWFIVTKGYPQVLNIFSFETNSIEFFITVDFCCIFKCIFGTESLSSSPVV